ncbi:uncharacterized protein PV09_05911 [Verruconis gallopava]|uniref:MICOS complex subunit n=1 Tax=Verruconis gallopava TaxID=253628 RepID=A0A0D1YQG7_9PEZI|nr:uncharacterized protein PV09_05911 [Verruconis gallopava]KIW02857.1 hypothetical protein PV09_05911 [Verruconis gallopava]
MAARLLLRPGATAKLAAVGAAGLVLYPTSELHAETSQDDAPVPPKVRKPIYDDEVVDLPSPSESKSSSPTPTERLTAQVARARLFLHKYAAKTEDAANDALAKSFDLERSFTSTVASLAPPKESNEKLMPGLIYVLVSAMGSSIFVRNRNILLRASAPLAVGIGAGYYFIPITMGNVGELAWKYESKYPALADTHLRVKERITRFVQTGIAHSKMTVGMVEDKVGEARESVENWVSKGK